MNHKIIFITTLLLLYTNAYPAEQKGEAQSMTIDYAKGIISISSKDIPLTEVFTALTEKTGVKFIYDKELLSDKRITIQLTEKPLQDAIKEILTKCDIKNYTTKLGENPDKPIEQIEILPTLTSSPGIEIPYIEEPEPYYPETQIEEPEPPEYEEPIKDKGSEYKPPEYKPPESKPIEEVEPEEETKEESGTRPGGWFIKTRTYTPSETTTPQPSPGRKTSIPSTPSTEIKDASNQYYPPGSEYIKKEPSAPAYDGGTIPDMSDQYHPPGSK